MAAAQDAWADVLSRITIADLASAIDTDSDGAVLADLRRWLTADPR
jgi:DNA-binding IscR family transcriptional regulator